MPPTEDRNAKVSIWEILYLGTDSFSRTPETIRAWTTIISGLALISLIVWIPLSLSLLIRLGWDAFWLPNPQYQEASRNFFLAFAGVFGAPFLVWRAWVAHQQAKAATDQASVALESHITGIFSKSVELLGFVREIKTASVEGLPIVRSLPNIESRLGALYSLERLLSESEKDQRAILETLCAYIRENSPLPLSVDNNEAGKPHASEMVPAPTRRSDVQAAITIIGRRPEQLRMRSQREGWNLDFREANFIGYDFSKLNYDRSDFSGSFLNDAKMPSASFVNSIFSHTDLSGADMTNTNFQVSTFEKCKVKKALIKETDFSLAIIIRTDLREATIESLNISGANLEEAFSHFSLDYALKTLKTTGADHFNAQEVVGISNFFQKATYDNKTNVSQAVHDIMKIMSNVNPNP
jgi:hypothetical protein